MIASKFALILNKVSTRYFDNDIQAFIPQLWAEESLAILEENMVMAQLVHRDFEPIVANFGDVVNTRRPGEFVATRKTPADDVTVQDATSTNVQVPLNMHVHVAFLIRDGEESKSFKDLVAEYMMPAMLAQARHIDLVLLGQVYQFLGNTYGGLGQLTSTVALDYIIGTRKVLNRNKAYVQNRNLILTPNSEAAILNLNLFLAAQQVGDDGTALREASLGRKLGFDMFMCQNASSIVSSAGSPATVSPAGKINNASGYPVGTVTMTVNTYTGAVANGQWITIAGDYTPYQIVDHTETLGATTSITIDRGLVNAVAHQAVVTTYKVAAVAQAVSPTGYAKSWSKKISTDLWAGNVPEVGEVVSFGTPSTGVVNSRYSIIQVVNTGTNLFDLLLDRPLDVAIADDDAVNIGPIGEFNFAFHRNALALVIRPLAQPRLGTGALSAVVNYNGLSMRATITYNGTKQGHLVTLDMLCGIATLDTHLGAVLLG